MSEVAARLLPWMMRRLRGDGDHRRRCCSTRSRCGRTRTSSSASRLIMLVLAGLNAFVFHNGIYRSVSEWDLAPRAPSRGARRRRLLARAVGGDHRRRGRMIAYNWFDCDKQPQRWVIVAAGCVGPDRDDRRARLLPFFQWCEASALGSAISSRPGRSPSSNRSTCWRSSVIGGAVLIVDLRLLGLGPAPPDRSPKSRATR